jgi:menaquinone-dependent protoporphyrinogen oxidase
MPFEGMPILLLYRTCYGSTAEIAERIAARIDTQLNQTEVHNIQDFDATTLPNYTAIIIGSAVHGAHWLPEVTTFCSVHKDVLVTKPLYAFSVGAPGAMPRLFGKRFRAYEEKDIYDGLQKTLNKQVQMHQLFNGKIGKGDMPGCVRICCGMFGGMRYGDLREWDKVEAWGDEVAADLKKRQGEF